MLKSNLTQSDVVTITTQLNSLEKETVKLLELAKLQEIFISLDQQENFVGLGKQDILDLKSSINIELIGKIEEELNNKQKAFFEQKEKLTQEQEQEQTNNEAVLFDIYEIKELAKTIDYMLFSIKLNEINNSLFDCYNFNQTMYLKFKTEKEKIQELYKDDEPFLNLAIQNLEKKYSSYNLNSFQSYFEQVFDVLKIDNVIINYNNKVANFTFTNNNVKTSSNTPAGNTNSKKFGKKQEVLDYCKDRGSVELVMQYKNQSKTFTTNSGSLEKDVLEISKQFIFDSQQNVWTNIIKPQ